MKPWKITWGARTWTEDDLLAGDLVSVQILLGGSWTRMDPWSGPAELLAFITALECRTSGRDLDEVMREVRESPAVDVLTAIEEREVVDAPAAAVT